MDLSRIGEKMVKTDNVHIQMCVWNPKQVRLINMKTKEGIGSPMEAYGFDALGNPVMRKNDPRLKYEIVGETPSVRVDLSATAILGVRQDLKRDANKQLIITPKIFGFEAMAIMLSRAGCSPPRDLETQISMYVKNGMGRIWLYRESNVRGMANAYGFSDYWNIAIEPPEADYDGFNAFLKTLKSNYRIITKKQIDVLRQNELNQLEAGLE